MKHSRERATSRRRFRTAGSLAACAASIGAAGLALVGCVAPSRDTATGGSAPQAREERPEETAGRPAPDTLLGLVHTPGVLAQEAWTFANTEGLVLRTTHYRVFTTESSPVLRTRVVDFLELALAHYRTAAVAGEPLPPPPIRLDTYLMDNHAQWQALTRRLLREEAGAALGIARGGFATRGVGVYFDIGLFDTLAVAAHEGWHQYTQRTFRQPLPVFLEEGMATFMEGHRWRDGVVRLSPWANVERYDALREAHTNGRLFTVEQLADRWPTEMTGGDREALLTYYAQVWALTHFLKSGENGRYRDGVVRLLRDAADGRLAARLRSAGFGAADARRVVAARRGTSLLVACVLTPVDTTLEEFEDRYAAFLDRVVAVGSRDRIVQGESPVGGDR